MPRMTPTARPAARLSLTLGELGGSRSVRLLHHSQVDGRDDLIALIAVNRGSNLFSQVFGNRIGNAGRLLRVWIINRNIHQHGAIRVGSGNARSQFLYRGVKTQIVNNRLQYRLGFYQLRIRLNLAIDVIGARAQLACIAGCARRSR